MEINAYLRLEGHTQKEKTCCVHYLSAIPNNKNCDVKYLASAYEIINGDLLLEAETGPKQTSINYSMLREAVYCLNT